MVTIYGTAQVDALERMGAERSDAASFFGGEWVRFAYATVGGANVEGFLFLEAGLLTAHLFTINTLNAGPAGIALVRFRRRALDLATALGLSSVELQGGTVINQHVASWPGGLGFGRKVANAPEQLGGGTQEVFFLQVKLP